MAWPLGGGGVAPVRVVLVWFLCGSSHLGVAGSETEAAEAALVGRQHKRRGRGGGTVISL